MEVLFDYSESVTICFWYKFLYIVTSLISKCKFFFGSLYTNNLIFVQFGDKLFSSSTRFFLNEVQCFSDDAKNKVIGANGKQNLGNVVDLLVISNSYKTHKDQLNYYIHGAIQFHTWAI